jgi:chemotaxis protein MotB
MEANGLHANQISQVRGYADQKLRVPGNPLEPSNRRISLIVQYVVKDDDDLPTPKTDAEGKPLPAQTDQPSAPKPDPGKGEH